MVAIPLGFVAASVLAYTVALLLGAYAYDISHFHVSRPGDLAANAVLLAGSILLPVFLVRRSPSVWETFRRSLPVIGFASAFLDSLVIALYARGFRPDPDPNAGGSADAVALAFALLVLVSPVLCPVLYYWIVPSENRRPLTRTIRDRSASGTRKWTLTWLVAAGAVAAWGLAIGNPGLALLGIAGVVVLAVMLIWME